MMTTVAILYIPFFFASAFADFFIHNYFITNHAHCQPFCPRKRKILSTFLQSKKAEGKESLTLRLRRCAF
jgi:hypothetical protein